MSGKAIVLSFILLWLFTAPVAGDVPASERAALIDLYNSTNGERWTDNSGWKALPLEADGFSQYGSEGSWYGITVSENHVTKIDLNNNNLRGSIPVKLVSLSNLKELNLISNQLAGSIPGELGNLTKLENLYLGGNQLRGSIPPELGALSNLSNLYLAKNRLSGGIPPGLGGLSKLENLDLQSNTLSGEIPPEVGNLSNLKYLKLQSNRLSGGIPRALMKNLDSLVDGSSDIRWNALYTNDEELRNFLNLKQEGGIWENTQTIAPKGVAARPLSGASVEVGWTPIAYSDDEGGYRVFYSQTPGPPYILFDKTGAKSDYYLVVNKLQPLSTYYFVVQTITASHGSNDNDVESEYSEEVSTNTPGSVKTISGKVFDGTTGEGIPGVTLTFSSQSNPGGKFEETDLNGYYQHTVPYGWTGIVKPEKGGYTFEPEEEGEDEIKNLKLDKILNFKAQLLDLEISGYVTSWGKGEEGEGIEGVTLTFEPGGERKTADTKSNGFYTKTVPFGWNGTVTPSKGDMRFSPANRDYTSDPVKGRRENQDFELSVSLRLDVERKEDSSVIIRKDYAEIELKVEIKYKKEEELPPHVQKFTISRKESSESDEAYKTIKELIPINTDAYLFKDIFLESGKAYTYRARAIDGDEKVIGQSKEKTIEPLKGEK